MRESDILYERGNYWVSLEKVGYVVWCNGFTHAVSDSAYPADKDGKSCAIARCDYMARRSER